MPNELIAAGSPAWVLLSVIYHHVLAQSPSPEAAKIAISTARQDGRLRLRAEVREHKPIPGRLNPGEQPAQIFPKCDLDLGGTLRVPCDWQGVKPEPCPKSFVIYPRKLLH